MNSIKKNIGDAEFEFFVDSYDTRHGFAHRCELYLNGEQIADDRAYYTNRTWERYQYQTVMLSCVLKAYEQAKARIVNSEKEKRGWSRLTQLRRNEIAKIVDEQDGIKVLKLLEKEVRDAKYGTEEERKRLETLDCMIAVLEILHGKSA